MTLIMLDYVSICCNSWQYTKKENISTDYVLKENCLFILCAQLSYTPDNLIWYYIGLFDIVKFHIPSLRLLIKSQHLLVKIRRSGIFNVKFEHNSHLVLAFLLLTLNR